jgi:hypothetical protein
MIRSELFNWCRGHRGRQRSLQEHSSVRPPEAELAVGLSLDLETLFVDRTVVPPTQHREIRQLRGASVRPVADVMPLAERLIATGKATTFVAMLKRAPQRRRDRPCTGANLHDSAICIVSHRHAAGVARQALRRFRGNARAALEHRLARRLGICQHLRVDVTTT